MVSIKGMPPLEFMFRKMKGAMEINGDTSRIFKPRTWQGLGCRKTLGGKMKSLYTPCENAGFCQSGRLKAVNFSSKQKIKRSLYLNEINKIYIGAIYN